jgi:succinyl-diaminopimelate desuccinylase
MEGCPDVHGSAFYVCVAGASPVLRTSANGQCSLSAYDQSVRLFVQSMKDTHSLQAQSVSVGNFTLLINILMQEINGYGYSASGKHPLGPVIGAKSRQQISATLMSSTLSLATSLLERRSITPDDAGCQQLISERLRMAGFTCETLSSGPVLNLLAIKEGTDEGKLLAFAGHTDVVPPGPVQQWTSAPFLPTIRDGRLFARGAADMKAAIAAFVVACEQFLARNAEHTCGIGLLITSDEEGSATDGTIRVVEEFERRGRRINYCIVGEPTSIKTLGDTIKTGRRGLLSGNLIIKGVRGHVAYPHLAVNPIHQLAPALAALTAERWDTGNDDFPPTTFQVSNINAGSGADNVIPDAAEICFNLRFSPESAVVELKQRIEAILTRHGLDYEIAWTVGAHPFIKPKGRLTNVLESSILETTGERASSSTSGGTSDARFISRIADEIAEFGMLGGGAHQVDESVPVADLDRLKDVYLGVLEGLVR